MLDIEIPYPTLEEVDGADLEQLDYWYRNLESPGYSAIKNGLGLEAFEKLLDRELPILERIKNKLRGRRRDERSFLY